MAVISKKICLLGDFGVGKTSLIRRFVDRQFSDAYLSTVGVKISRKLVNLPEYDKELQLVIWDIEGKTQFKGIAATYLQGAKAALLVGDCTRPESLETLNEHVKLFHSVNKKGLVAIAFNKIDLVGIDQAQSIEQSLKDQLGDRATMIAPTSAKTGQNVDELFYSISENLL